MEETDDTKGTYTCTTFVPSIRVILCSTPLIAFICLLSYIFSSNFVLYLAFLSPFPVWAIDRYHLQREEKLVIGQKFTTVGPKIGVSYFLKPLNWKEALEVDSFIYSLVDTSHIHVIARYGLISRQITRITIL